MQPVRRLDPLPDWVSDPAVISIMQAAMAGGGRVRFVGGCVRNSLMGLPVADIDAATDVQAEEVMRRIEAAGIRAVPTGLDHGTVTAVKDHVKVEITTLRVDVETDGRRARIAYTDDWAEDAKRRDLTMNALFLDPDGTLYDPVGGLADIEAGRVRFVGEAERRIQEDVLRLLRFFRFHAHYGRMAPDEDGLAACKRFAPLLPNLAGERIRDELLKLLAARDPAPTFYLMRQAGVLSHALPEATHLRRLAALTLLTGEMEEAAPDPLRRLASILPDAKAGKEVAVRLRLSNAERDRLVAMLKPAADIDPAAEPQARRRLLYAIGDETYRDLVLLDWARRLADQPGAVPAWVEAGYRVQLAAADGWVRPKLPVNGEDAMALGIPTGPAVGKLLKQVEGWWADADFRPDREACLARLKELAG